MSWAWDGFLKVNLGVRIPEEASFSPTPFQGRVLNRPAALDEVSLQSLCLSTASLEYVGLCGTMIINLGV